MTLKINFNLNLPDSCCTLVPKNGVWTVPKIAACQIAKNAALLIPDYISKYTSNSLRDFIFESNKGKFISFVSTREEAIKILADGFYKKRR